MSLDRRVLEQDMPQYEQSTKAAREKRDKEALQQYEAEQREFDRQQQEAETQQQNEIQTTQEDKRQAVRDKYEKQISEIKEKRAQALRSAYASVYGEGGTGNRSDYNTKQNKISNKYEAQIKALEEKQRIESGRAEFSIKYPGVPISQSDLRTFSDSPSRSLVGIYQNKMEAKQSRLEYQQKADVQTARNEARAIRESIANRQDNFVTGYGLESGAERAANIKPTPNVITGKQAVESRRPLINVKTVETIYGGQQIETNPRAFVNSLSRQNVDAAGRPKQPVKSQDGSRVVYSFQNVSDVQDPSALALLEFQSQLKTQTAPSPAIYREILRERGLKETPLAKRIIKTYSSTGKYQGYKETVPAKGERGLIKTPEGKTLFNLETGEGSVRIGRLMGFEYSKPVMVNELGNQVQGPPQPEYYILDAFGNPRTDKSDNPILLKSEKAIERLSKTEKQSTLIVPTLTGSKEIKSENTKQSALGSEIQKNLNQLEKDSTWLQTNPKSSNLLLATYQTIAPVGIAAGKSLGSMMAFGVNYAEQTYTPFLAEKLGLKQPKKVAPIQVKDTSGIVILPVNFEKLDIMKPETYRQSLLNPLDKEYQSRQAEYIKRYGPLEYASGIVFDYGGLKGGTRLIRTGNKIVKAPVSIIKSVGKSKTITEKVGGSAGIISKQKPIPFGKVTTQKPEPNPFGKERRIPYAINQARKRIVSGMNEIKTQGIVIGKKTKRVIQKDISFQNRTVKEGRNINIPNVTRPTPKQFSPFQESIRIGINIKKSALARKLSEMENVYRGGIPESTRTFSPLRESLAFGLRMKKRQLGQIIERIPEIKTPKNIIRFKKQVQFIGKRTIKGLEERERNIYKSITERKTRFVKSIASLKPTVKIPYLPQKTSLEIAKFKQKEKFGELRKRINKITSVEETPKVTVPVYTKQGLKNLYRIIKDPPLDYKKIFREANLKKDFNSYMKFSPFGRIKGKTAKREFQELLNDDIKLPKTKLPKFPFRSRLKDLLYSGRYDEKRNEMLKDIYKLSNKGNEILTARKKTFDLMKRQFVSPDTESEILRMKLQDFMKKPRGIERLRSETMSFAKRGKLLVTGATVRGKKVLYSFGLKAPAFPPSKHIELANVVSDIGVITKRNNLFINTQKSERFSATFTKAGLGGQYKTVKELIDEGKALAKNKQLLKNNLYEMARKGQVKLSKAFIKKNTGEKIYTGVKVNLPRQIKPIFKIPKQETTKTPLGKFGVYPIKETIVEEMIREAKLSKPKNQFYKKVTIDKYIPKTPKEWESWKGIGIVTAAGTLSMLGLGQEQKAEALPFAQLGRLTVREVQSGGQILIYPESKASIIAKNVLKGPKPKLEQEEPQKTEPKLSMKMPEILETSFRLSTPQATRIETKQFTKIMPRIDTSVITQTRQKPKQIEKNKYRQAAKLKPIQITIPKQKLRQVQKIRYAEPEIPKQPSRQAQPSALKQKTPQLLRFARPQPMKRPPVAIFLMPDKEPEKTKRKESKPGEKADFLGNVSETSISGIFKRNETVYGQKKINRLLKGDIRVVSGKKRATKRGPIKWKEGKKGDMFGFKNEAKKKRKFSIL